MNKKTNYELKHSKAKKHYYFDVDGLKPHIKYAISDDNRIFLLHTIVPEELGGKGIGSALIEAVLKEVDKKEYTLVPVCWFVAKYLGKNEKWQKLIFRNVKLLK